jgi:hypothetical protein
MTKRTVLMAIALLGAAPAHALKLEKHLTRANARREGFTIRATPRDKGAVEFEVKRDTTRGTFLGYNASLSTIAEPGKRVQRKIEPEKQEKESKVLTWRFTLPREQLSGAVLTVTEMQTVRGLPDLPLVGGGTCFDIVLTEFAAPRR